MLTAVIAGAFEVFAPLEPLSTAFFHCAASMLKTHAAPCCGPLQCLPRFSDSCTACTRIPPPTPSTRTACRLLRRPSARLSQQCSAPTSQTARGDATVVLEGQPHLQRSVGRKHTCALCNTRVQPGMDKQARIVRTCNEHQV